MKIYDREIRFGFMAVQKRFITSQQVVDALRIQVEENIAVGKHRRIGQILLDQGLINRSQLNEVLSGLEKIRQEGSGEVGRSEGKGIGVVIERLDKDEWIRTPVMDSLVGVLKFSKSRR